MVAFIAHNMAPIMFMALVVFLLIGYPVAFSLGAVGLVFFFIGVELAPFSKCVELSSICKRIGDQQITLDWPLLQAMPERIYGGVMANDILLAIPFFTFMGLILERSGMAEDLLDTIGQVFGTVRGGLAYAVIFVGALLAATTGVVAASVISMGLISLPIMLRYGYDRRLAAGTIAASGTLAQIIPPSLVLIVLADQLGSDVGAMYKGAFTPGIVLSGLYMGYVFLMTLVAPKSAPGLPVEDIGFREENGNRGLLSLGLLVIASGAVAWFLLRNTKYEGSDYVILSMTVGTIFAFVVAVLNWLTSVMFGIRVLSRLAQQVTFVMVPPLLLIFLVLGTIALGIATPTEGGAMGATGAMLVAALKRFLDNNPNRFNFAIIKSATEATAKLSAFVIFILIGARIFSLSFYGVNGHLWVEEHLRALPGGLYGFLIVVNIAIFLLAFFLDFFELAFIVIPLIKDAVIAVFLHDPTALAIAKSFNLVTPEEISKTMMVWFGVMLGVNMQTSFMHPPFGFALFYLRSVAPSERYKDRVTGKMMEPVTTGQIYWGAVPYVVIQVIMVTLVMMLPAMVLSKRPERATIDPTKVEDTLRNLTIPGIGGPAPGGGLPGLDAAPPPLKIQ
jgi:TRAP-type mannitol/chloroaromatic compound transport system permease large subunit